MVPAARLEPSAALVQSDMMRYFLDTEYDGFRGALLSIALVPEDGGEEFYAVIAHDGVSDPWVERYVVPFLNMVPGALQQPARSRAEISRDLSKWLLREHDAQSLVHFPHPVDALHIVADWPEDIAQICMLLIKGPGALEQIPPLSFHFVDLPGFSTAANSAVPHNALHDARALRDHIMNHLE